MPDNRASMSDNDGGIDGFSIEAFSLLGIALAITALRLCLQIYTSGFKGLRLEDGLATIGALLYTAMVVLVYVLDTETIWQTNHSMTDSERETLQTDSSGYQNRELASKLYLAIWISYSAALWTLKATLCVCLLRRISDFTRQRQHAFFSLGLLIVSWLAPTLTLLLSCRPLSHMWQIYPDPGRYCQSDNSPALVWTYFSFDLVSNLYLVALAVPVLFKARGALWGALCAFGSLGCGLFVLVAGIVRTAVLSSDRVDAAKTASDWAQWQAFAAVIVANGPALFSSLKSLIFKAQYTDSQRVDTSNGRVSSLWRSKSFDGSLCPSRPAIGQQEFAGPEDMEFITTPEKVFLPDPEYGAFHDKEDEAAKNSFIQRVVEVSIREECFVRPEKGPCGTCGNYTKSWSSNEDVTKPEQKSEFFAGHIHHHHHQHSHSSSFYLPK